MNRPTYVTNQHIEKQDYITETVADKVGYQVLKYMPPMSVCSHIIGKRSRRYIVKSIKRNCPPNASYLRDDGFAISTTKVDRLLTMADNAGAEAILLIQFSDDHIYFVNLSQTCPDSVGSGGRTDRGDEDDIETENYYRMDSVRKIV